MNNLKYYDVSACMQVIGTIYNNPAILDNEQYHFNEEDFANEFHKILFGSIHNLYVLGAKMMSIESIEKYLEQRPKKYAIYKNNKGSEYLANIKEMSEPAIFDYYYNRMKKMTLFRMYSKNAGMDLSWLYDPDNILDVKKKEAQEAWFDNTSLNDIVTVIDQKIDEIKSKYVDNSEDGVIQAGDGAIELLERLRQTPEIGYPLYGKLINAIHKGARLKKFYLRSAATGIGKALPNSLLIPTIKGYKPVGEIRAGDFVFNKDGNPVPVRAVFPQGKLPVWKISFTNGKETYSSKDHLWSYKTFASRYKDPNFLKTATLEEIYDFEPLTIPTSNATPRYNLIIPTVKLLNYPEKKLSLSPYLLGLFIGGYGFKKSRPEDPLTLELPFNYGKEIVERVAQEGGWDYVNGKKATIWHFVKKGTKKRVKNTYITVREALVGCEELYNISVKDLYIPKKYLESSIIQRKSLLTGILDANSRISTTARDSVVSGHLISCSKQLEKDFNRLCTELGLRCKTNMGATITDYVSIYYCITAENDQQKINLVSLPSKKEKALCWVKKREETQRVYSENYYYTDNRITKIEKLDYEEEMTCFYIDDPDHLFVINDGIITHNTRSMIADACNIACDEIYNLVTKKWEKNGTAEPTQFITTEQEEDEIQTMMIAFLSGVNEDHILEGTYEEDEWARVQKAAKILSKSPLYIKKLPDFSLEDIENAIKFGIREYKIRYVFMDYIHSSMKILSEISSKARVQGLREDNILFMISVRLKDLCNQYGIFIMSATQLNGQYTNADVYDQNLLRGKMKICALIYLILFTKRGHFKVANGET